MFSYSYVWLQNYHHVLKVSLLREIEATIVIEAGWCHWTGSPLVQIMACRLFGAKPLPESMMEYCYLAPWKQTSVKSQSKFIIVIQEMHLKISSGKWWPFCLGLNVLIISNQWSWKLRSPASTEIKKNHLYPVVSTVCSDDHGHALWMIITYNINE